MLRTIYLFNQLFGENVIANSEDFTLPVCPKINFVVSAFFSER